MLSDNEIKEQFQKIFTFSSEEERIEFDAQMLMFYFLSEVDRYQEIQGITNKALAQKMNTSASYLTQLFRGHKPLNFATIAKMQIALGIKFDVVARPIGNEVPVGKNIVPEKKQKVVKEKEVKAKAVKAKKKKV